MAHARYQYGPLKSPDSIRLLYLLPGAFEDEIQVKLKEVSLSKPPSYEALSYVWGSPTADDPISCHGEELLVTANCIAAMRRLRYKRKHRVLWIDAICICQGTIDERNHQVGLMGDIYSQATRVIIWLGEASPQSDFAISFMNDLHRIFKMKWLGPFRSRLLDKKIMELQNTEGNMLSRGALTSDALESIFHNPWFTRKWAIQEYVLSKDSYFQCGCKLLRASKLFVVILKFDHLLVLKGISNGLLLNYSFWTYLEYFNAIRQNLKGDYSGRKFSALNIFAGGRAQTAREPEDAVFALYGLLEKMDIIVPPPDYSQSVEQIYTEAAKSVILCDESLELLMETGESRDWPSLPSWVPDWGTQPKHGFVPMTGLSYIWGYAASKASTAKFAFLDENQSISVRGRFVDRITRSAKKYLAAEMDLEEFPEFQPAFKSEISRLAIATLETYREWIDIAHSLTTYPYGQTAKESIVRTLLRDDSIALPLKLIDSFDAYFRTFLPVPSNQVLTKPQSSSPAVRLRTERDFDHTGQKESDTMEEFLEEGILDYDAIWTRMNCDEKMMEFEIQCFHRCKRTRFFITSGGYMGRGLKAVQEGDLVALIAGVDMPMIIRKEGDLYRLKGPAYVHGIMRGEKWPEDEKDLVDIVLC